MVTTVRAFQAAGFVHYWFVQVDLDTLLSSGADQLSALITNVAEKASCDQLRGSASGHRVSCAGSLTYKPAPGRTGVKPFSAQQDDSDRLRVTPVCM